MGPDNQESLLQPRWATRVVVWIPWTTGGPAKQPLLQHNIPLPKGNNFPYSDSLIYSWLATTPTSLVNATYTSTWSAAAETNPRGDSDWCAIYSLPPVEKVPIWKDKLLIFSVRSSSHCLRWRISPMSKPNPPPSIKFSQIHRGKTCFSCEYQEPCTFSWCFSIFEDKGRWRALLPTASVSVWERLTVPSQQLQWLGPPACCAWGPAWSANLTPPEQ